MGSNLRVVTVKIPQSLLDQLDRLAITLKESRSELIRRALEMYVNTMNTMLSQKQVRIIVRRHVLQ